MAIIDNSLKYKFMKMERVMKVEYDRLNKVEKQLYEGIEFRQRKLMEDLLKVDQKRQCQKNRLNSFKQHRAAQQVKHPYNDGHWVNLAQCIDQLEHSDLEGIRQRQQERKKMKEEMKIRQKQRQQGMNIHRNRLQDTQSQFVGGIRRDKKNCKKQQVPWKLMRKLREHDVQQNKKRIEKMRENQINTMQRYHH